MLTAQLAFAISNSKDLAGILTSINSIVMGKHGYRLVVDYDIELKDIRILKEIFGYNVYHDENDDIVISWDFRESYQ